MWRLPIFQIKGLVACSECRIRNGGGQKFASQPKPSKTKVTNVSLHRLNNEPESNLLHLLLICWDLLCICFVSGNPSSSTSSQVLSSPACIAASTRQFRGQVDPLWKSIISVWFFQKSLYGGPCHRNHCWILIQLKSDLNWLTTFRLQSSVHPSQLDCHPKTS